MSFGYSVGDFITVGVLAWKLYQKGRDSVDEFKSISREVRGLHIVLEAIGDHWRANDLSPKHQQNLEVLTEGCHDTLHELELVLDNHKTLEIGRKLAFDRLKWATKNLAPIRNSLIIGATLLAMFHETVTASANSTILRSLNILVRDFQTGKREAPAFSQASRHSIQSDEETTWTLITNDFLTSGADATSVVSQHDFIKRWIDDVWIVEGADDTTESADTELGDLEKLPTASPPETEQPAVPTKPVGSSFPHAFERWETLSAHWEGLTAFWIRRLQRNEEEINGQPIMQQMARQITDLAAAETNLFHAVVEFQRLRASSERKFQRWFFDTRAEQERSREDGAKLEEKLQQEQQLRASSERKFQRWFFETRAEQERSREDGAKLEEKLRQERQLREAVTKLLLDN